MTASPRILILENDTDIAQDLDRAFRGLGCDVVVLVDGDEGLARAVSDEFCVIVVSAELPGTNGFRLCNRIKNDPIAKRVPLFLLSSRSSAEMFERHQQLPTHADGYFH